MPCVVSEPPMVTPEIVAVAPSRARPPPQLSVEFPSSAGELVAGAADGAARDAHRSGVGVDPAAVATGVVVADGVVRSVDGGAALLVEGAAAAPSAVADQGGVVDGEHPAVLDGAPVVVVLLS